MAVETPKRLRDVSQREEPTLAEPCVAGCEVIVGADPRHHHRIHRLAPCLERKPVSVRRRAMGTSVLVGQEPIDFGDDLRTGLPRGPGGHRPREGQRLGGPAAEADVHDELRSFDQCDILENESQEPLPFTGGRGGVAPEARDILRQRGECGSVGPRRG